MFEGIKRHVSIFRESWKQDKEAAKHRKPVIEPDFLPAALEVLEKPASPLGRTIVYTIIAFFLIAIVWSLVGKIDVVASAQGKLVPQGNVKTIQPAELGVVRAIHASNGDTVKAGDVLVELDPSMTSADEERTGRERLVAAVNAARDEAILRFLDEADATYYPPEGATPAMIRMQERLIASQISEYQAQLAALDKQMDERRVDYELVVKQLVKLEETLPLLEQQVDARRTLLEKGLTSRLLFLELQERFVAHKQDVLIERDRLMKARAAIQTVERQMEQVRQEFRRTTLTEYAEFTEQAAALEQELIKARTRHGLQNLTAPVDGVVQQRAIHTIGGVVQPGEPVMVIVPGTAEGGVELQVEALVLNKDIGFVHEGQPVEVKLEAFPFTKYGVIHGTVERIATDAVQDEHLGLVYPAKVSMDATTIMANGRVVNLGPGMSVTAEIKTGKRRLIEFVLSPLLRYQDEALRER
ncbi:MAG: HlyD family type I secretion periplasmic adaptor subunit [Alphaproteobacteria bacterium]